VGPLRCGKRFVLVGDHHQLPPLVRNRDAAAAGMDVSLFKRLCDAHPKVVYTCTPAVVSAMLEVELCCWVEQAVVELRVQYRMNADIQVLPNALVYNNALRCGSDDVANARLCLPRAADSSCPAWLQTVMAPSCAVTFLNTDPIASIGAENSTRWSGKDARQFRMVNSCEVAVMASIVATAVACGCPATCIGVISPYRAQLRLVRSVLPAEFAEVEVCLCL
jgi:DNA replication ATP-dependent helicase Dna2